MTDAELQELCQKWQRVLRLQDWRINVKFVDTEHIPDNALGACKVFADSKLALIKLSRPEAIDKTDGFSAAFPYMDDTERTLVHELLHIHLDGLFDGEADKLKQTMKEQAIEAITDGLIGLDQG